MPYVRRLRLSREIRQLRADHGCSTGDLAHAIGVARQRISVLENCHVRPDVALVAAIVDHFDVGPRRRDTILRIAAEGRASGWWARYADEMGPRQAVCADLESGAGQIREYQLALVPGLLQLPAFSEARVQSDPSATTDQFDPVRALQARANRQRHLAQADGPNYEAVIDELAIRRLATPATIMREQLDHLVALTHDNPRITIRVLPIAANVIGLAVPRSAFSIYRSRDPDDPLVVSVDSLTQDLILDDEQAVGQYVSLYDRLRAAALTPQRTTALLRTITADLDQQNGTP